MKKSILHTGITLLFAALFLILIGLGLHPAHAYAEERETQSVSYGDTAGYDFRITDFNVTMDMAKNRVIKVTEKLNVQFSYPRSGIIRDFNLGEGVRYTNISALRDGKSLYTSFQDDENDILSYYLGDPDLTLSSGTDYLYEISYTMTIPALSEEGYLPLDVLGFGWQCPIDVFTANITLPDGLTAYKIYSELNDPTESDDVEATQTGNTLTLSATGMGISYGGTVKGVTLDLKFKDGALSAPPVDPSPFVAAGMIILVCILFVLLKIGCRQPLFTKTVNFTAPDEMDPLVMGKLIDNAIDAEDIGALVFHLASKGYLTIDLSEGEKDPVLIRTQKEIPSTMPAHLQVFLNGLFNGRERVRISELNNSFYKTADEVKTIVNGTAKKIFSKKGAVRFVLFTVLSIFCFGCVPLIYGLFTVASNYFMIYPLIIALISYALSASVSLVAQMRIYKWKRGKCFAFRLAAIAAGCLPGLLSLLGYNPCFSRIAILFMSFGAAIAGMVSVYYIIRTEEHVEKLGHILGLKDFILYTERDKIEFMLKENPELYYDILPYAQVLGVTDAWADKFKGLAVSAPTYCNYNSGDLVFDFIVWNHLFRSLNTGMSRSFVSRPSSAGKGGNFGGFGGGGFGGGFGGGGFGGGGGRSF